uniref:DNA cytosine methyltransferase n=1 Tax=Acinetobacter baumannii TaxID=470 RepID=UPI001142909F
MNMCLNLNLLPHELIVDNFAGGGGTSTGLEKAFGRPVDIAINHDPKAIAMHRANHPNTRHFCEDVWDVDPVKVTNNQPVGLVWLSPDCKHFSKAKGGKPVEKKIRGLAWIALRWADLTRPRIIMLENVEEFKTWGRLGKDGFPSKKHKGETFRCFVNALRHQGYKVEWRVMSARDYGSPTLRRRFFLVARRDNFPIVWPKPTHAAPDSKAVKTGKLKPWRITAECIDWSIPCPSNYTRKKPLVEATCRRKANGLV